MEIATVLLSCASDSLIDKTTMRLKLHVGVVTHELSLQEPVSSWQRSTLALLHGRYRIFFISSKISFEVSGLIGTFGKKWIFVDYSEG